MKRTVKAVSEPLDVSFEPPQSHRSCAVGDTLCSIVRENDYECTDRFVLLSFRSCGAKLARSSLLLTFPVKITSDSIVVCSLGDRLFVSASEQNAATDIRKHTLLFFTVSLLNGATRRLVLTSGRFPYKSLYNMVQIYPDEVLLCGGEYSETCHRISITKRSATPVSKLPEPLSKFSICRANDHVYIVASATGAHLLSDRLYCYSLAEDCWGSILFPMGRRLNAGSSLLGQSFLLVYGGFAQQELSDLWLLDLETGRTATLNLSIPLPPVQLPCVFRSSREVFLLGGVSELKGPVFTQTCIPLALLLDSIDDHHKYGFRASLQKELET